MTLIRFKRHNPMGKQGFVNGLDTPDRCAFGFDPWTHAPCRARAEGLVIFNRNALPFGLPIGVAQPLCGRHYKWTLAQNDRLLADHPEWKTEMDFVGGILYNAVRYNA